MSSALGECVYNPTSSGHRVICHSAEMRNPVWKNCFWVYLLLDSAFLRNDWLPTDRLDALQFVPFGMLIYRLPPCRLSPSALPFIAFCITNCRAIVKNACNQCHNVTAGRNPLAFTALRRDIAPPFNVTTVTLRLAPWHLWKCRLSYCHSLIFWQLAHFLASWQCDILTAKKYIYSIYANTAEGMAFLLVAK